MTEKSVDLEGEFFIRLLRRRAHLASARENPHVSKEAVILNNCADDLERLHAPTKSEFDQLMK
ncbi:hypothetical protein ACTJJ7_16185 [Phyllobacterium sp. 22229]|uniref:hypothetical protein n=1 Tax=Phyllobacterium sp. 22229 TaxID=3453895 RepID=UPI003F842C8E